MTRADVREAIEGTHPRLGRTVALGLNVFILLSAAGIAVETLPDLPARVQLGLDLFEVLVLVVFLTEYLVRLVVAERPLAYALSFWGIIDLLACLPALSVLNAEWTALRSLRALRLLRLLHLPRTEAAMDRLIYALRTVQGDLAVFGLLALLVLYFAAVGIYIFEHEAQPDQFGSIPESFWWAVVSFTTVGYGDAFPITTGGRVFTTVILFIGLGVIAVPTAVITSALIDHTRHERERKERHEASQLAERHLHPRSRRRPRGPGLGR